jgi:hypothetical protein
MAYDFVINITEIHRYAGIILVKEEGDNSLRPISDRHIYDYSKAKHFNKITLVGKRERRARISPKIVRQLFQEQDGTCFYCFKYLGDTEIYHVDHIIPLIFGGSNAKSNLAVACRKCNLRKSDRLFPDIYSIRLFMAAKG